MAKLAGMKSTVSRTWSGLFAAGLLAAFAFVSPSAQGSSITYSLDITSTCCGPGPYGSVTLTTNGTNEVDFLVQLNDPNVFVFGGQDGVFGFNLNVPAANVTITVSAASIAAGFSSVAVGGTPQNEHMDGFGKFNYVIQGDANHTQGASTPIGQTLSFSVVDTAGPINLDSFAINSIGGIASFFSADIANRPLGGTVSTGIVGTDGSTPPQSIVPEPATFAIAGVGLLGLGLLRRRKN
jgi:hypothetical protein